MDELTDAIVRTALDAANPRKALERAWPSATVRSGAPCRIVAFGKASREMLAVTLDTCKGCITRAAIATDRPELVPTHPWLTSLHADHPLPTTDNLRAAEAIASCVSGSSPEETLIALVSGGGSAHLASPVPPTSLNDLAQLSSFLMKAGATIHELNTVRRHVERFKGGKLAAKCPARCIDVFVMSDVIGDPLHDIASGPFAPDPTRYRDAREVVKKYNADRVSPIITNYLDKGAAECHAETPKPDDVIFARVRHHIVASNRACVDAIAAMLESRGIRVADRRYDVQGESHEWAKWLATRFNPAEDRGPCAWIIGGEPVVNVGAATGRGGPSQEVALHAAKLISGLCGLQVVAFSTDGIDGPSANAGASVDRDTWGRAISLGLDPQAALDGHDSAAVHERLGAAIRTGPTGTNLNHVAVAIANRKGQMAKGR